MQSNAAGRISSLAAASALLLCIAGCAGLGTDRLKRDREEAGRLPGGRAVWLWNTETILEAGHLSDFIAFCNDNRVTLVLAHLPKPTNRIKSLVRRCSQNDIRIHALTGDPAMALERHHDDVMEFIDKVARYNATHTESARISGIHLDIEPYLLDTFEDSRDAVLNSYASLFRKAAGHVVKIDSGMLLGADIPFWFDKRDNDNNYKYCAGSFLFRKPVYQHIIKHTDYVCIMAYRNYITGRDGIINISAEELDYANRVDGRVFVGLETGSGEGIPEKTTFSGKPASILSAVMNETQSRLAKQESFCGLAIHHYDSWRRLIMDN